MNKTTAKPIRTPKMSQSIVLATILLASTWIISAFAETVPSSIPNYARQGSPAGEATNFAWFEGLGNEYFTTCWKAANTKGAETRTWFGDIEVTNFTATWDIASGNCMPSLNHRIHGPATTPLPKLSTIPEGYTVNWSGTGSVENRGSGYDFAVYFWIHPVNHWVGSSGGGVECYIVQNTSRRRKIAEEKFVHLGEVGDYKYYKQKVKIGGDKFFWQLWAVRNTDTWSGPVDVQKIIKYWADKSDGVIGMDSPHYLGHICILAEVYATKGNYTLTNIDIPSLKDPPTKTQNEKMLNEETPTRKRKRVSP
jgi:hypothetical protein